MNYCNCPQCKTVNCPAATDHEAALRAEYILGVNAACERLKQFTLTAEDVNEGFGWDRECPQTFAELILNELLPKNVE